MGVGDYVIANDLLGVIEEEKEDSFVLKDSNGRLHPITKSSCHEVVSSYALAASIYVKARKKVGNAKNKS